MAAGGLIQFGGVQDDGVDAGRLEPKTGMIQCAYHGWEFDRRGACTRIPQVEEEVEAKMRASPRACAVPFPARVALRCLWAWLGPGEPVGHPEDGLADTPLRSVEVVDTYSRDVPFGYERFPELLVDASALGEAAWHFFCLRQPEMTVRFFHLRLTRHFPTGG
ncbi:unnamed protein product [Prorocentrum cordatum]|uniref:Rieske domain-containing protein n=1 Tax=Prorocentrum cordatum TaxID=2364126 RepID=A0ABN9TFC8_9DINO|nr:unnamed protein product [Polarella glacialis]